MNCIPSKFADREDSGPQARRYVMPIALSLLAAMTIAQPLLAQPATPINNATQTIALKPAEASEQSPIGSSSHDLRLLGYGLFLLQIGLIPLKLAKGNAVQTIAVD
jgi:hypothetical protein